jgi:hypothetical protein
MCPPRIELRTYGLEVFSMGYSDYYQDLLSACRGRRFGGKESDAMGGCGSLTEGQGRSKKIGLPGTHAL